MSMRSIDANSGFLHFCTGPVKCPRPETASFYREKRANNAGDAIKRPYRTCFRLKL